jgi:carboxyl-terminal processing protease
MSVLGDRVRALVATLALVVLSSAFSYYAGAAGLFPRLNDGLLGLTLRRAAPITPLSPSELAQLKEVQQFIKKHYVDQVTDEDLIAGALKGIVQATNDRYSSYMTAAEYDRFVEHLKESFSGIGVRVELSTRTNLVTVVQPLKGTPGERAGLRAGDAIIAVDGKDITRSTLEDAVQMIRGPKGTKVQLTVRREGVDQPFELVIERATIQMTNLEYRLVDTSAGIGYLQIIEFNSNIGRRVRDAIADLKRQGMTRGLVLDLRQNPGGLLHEAVDVASVFLRSGDPVVHIVSRGGQKDTLKAQGRGPLGLNLVVLVDRGSASASEIVAGAIKDSGIGVLIGEKTFGKGSVQSFFDLEGGAGLRLTTARYLTAGGHLIHGTGIEPDIAVELVDRRVMPGDPDDNQLARAIELVRNGNRAP